MKANDVLKYRRHVGEYKLTQHFHIQDIRAAYLSFVQLYDETVQIIDRMISAKVPETGISMHQ